MSQGLKVVLGFASIVISRGAISCILLNYFKIYNLLVSLFKMLFPLCCGKNL